MTTPSSPLHDKSPDRITESKALETDLTSKPSTSGNFQSYMNGQKAGSFPTQETSAPTPLSLSSTKPLNASNLSMDSLIQQAKNAQDGLGIIEEQIHTMKNSNGKLKRSQADLLKNKLLDAKDYGRAVGQKINATTPEASKPSQGGGTLERFLSYVGDGQNQFIAVQEKLKELSSSNEPINPADMLVIQSKLSIAQQEIEYASTLLGKVMTSATTIMNIQL